jgi:ATP-dependent exoDNAse (exonuclease V) alpha subunit
MAIYHFSAKIIARSRGQSAVAAAAYRRATKFKDARLGYTQDYSKKEKVIHGEIVIPENSPAWLKTLIKTNNHQAAEQLWNLVEQTERRKDSGLAREIVFALPLELNEQQNIALARSFIQEQFCQRGMIADFSVHWEKANPHDWSLMDLDKRFGLGMRKLCYWFGGRLGLNMLIKY